MNLADTLQRSAAARPDASAIVDAGEAISYASFWNATLDLARALEALGVRAGDRVGLRSPSGARCVALTYALWKLGATAVPIAPELKSGEAREVADSMALATVIADAPIETLAGIGFSAAGELQVFGAPFLFSRRAAPSAEGADANLAFIRFTSGTTGEAKGVALSHEAISARIASANAALKLGPGDRVLFPLSMAHHFAVTVCLYIEAGAAIIVPRNTLASGLIEAAARGEATAIYASPFHYQLMAADRSGASLGAPRWAISTASALEARTHRDFAERFGIPVSQAYGIIECGLACANLEDPADAPESVGAPLPGCEVRIDAGEVFIRTPGLFDAYANPWTPRAAALREGWFATGDLGRIDARDRLTLLGREKEVIICAGMKVFPQEIEAAINRCEGVAESRVLARPHPRLGQVIEAEVVAAPGAAPPTPRAIRDSCKRALADYKVPAEIRVVDSIPKTASGKIIRRDEGLGARG